MKNKFYFSSIIMAFVLCISQLHAQVNCPTPQGLTSTNISSSTATLTWTPVSNNVLYNVRYRPSNTTAWQTITTQTPSVNLTGLLCNQQYEWQVQTGCPSGTGAIVLSPFSPSAFFTTLACVNTCNVPTGLFANNITQTSVTLHWNSTGASSYRVRYRKTGTTAWTTVGANSNFKNLSGLTQATAYQWQVRSKCVNSAGTVYSAWSPTATFQTLGATTCATPTGLTSTAQAGNGVLLAWNSTGATSYNIRYKPSNTAAWTNTTSNTSSKTITNLLSNATYEWQVQGVCMSNGVIILSAWSASAFFTTLSPLTISPNPASDVLKIAFESSTIQNVNMSIRDFTGTSYSTISKSAAAGYNQYELNVSNLQNGIYYLELSGAEGRQTIKFYVQH